MHYLYLGREELTSDLMNILVQANLEDQPASLGRSFHHSSLITDSPTPLKINHGFGTFYLAPYITNSPITHYKINHGFAEGIV